VLPFTARLNICGAAVGGAANIMVSYITPQIGFLISETEHLNRAP
jgi:hypothetical protein